MPDPREVAAVAYLLFERLGYDAETDDHTPEVMWSEHMQPDIKASWMDDAAAAIAADHQWLAEHADEADQRLVDDFAYACECFGDSVNKPKAEQLEISNTIASLQTALLARLALRPAIDEAAVERSAIGLYEWQRKYTLASPYGGWTPVPWEDAPQEVKDRMRGRSRAAIEAFVAGGEG